MPLRAGRPTLRLGLASVSSRRSLRAEKERSLPTGEQSSLLRHCCPRPTLILLRLCRVLHELLGQLSKANLTLINSPVSPSELGRLIDAVTSGSLTGTSAKALLRTFLFSPTSTEPSLDSLIASNATTPAPADGSADEALNALCADVIETLPVEAAKVRAGQEKVLMRMVGEVMKRSKGRADAKKVGERLKEMLKAE